MDTRKMETIDPFCEVRKSLRLVYAYQRRMMDLARFIMKKLDMQDVRWHKYYSRPPIAYKSNEGNMFNGMWAWDFVFPYIMEYDFGEKVDESCKYTISIIQCSDTGFFDGIENDKNDVSKFLDVEKSKSKIIFYININGDIKDEEWKKWKADRTDDGIFDKREYMSSNFINKGEVLVSTDTKETVILYSLPMERFLDEHSTILALQDFVKYCNEQQINGLKLKVKA